jgi:hypothetical protein
MVDLAIFDTPYCLLLEGLTFWLSKRSGSVSDSKEIEERSEEKGAVVLIGELGMIFFVFFTSQRREVVWSIKEQEKERMEVY